MHIEAKEAENLQQSEYWENVLVSKELVEVGVSDGKINQRSGALYQPHKSTDQEPCACCRLMGRSYRVRLIYFTCSVQIYAVK